MASKQQTTKDKDIFSKLSKEEQLRREIENRGKNKKSMTVSSRLVLFLILPLCTGMLGLISSFFQNKFGKEPNPMNFDRDFIYPFLVTLVLVVVVSAQTMNFSTYKAAPLVSWPKVVKKKKVIRKTVVVDDKGNVIENKEEVLKCLNVNGNQSRPESLNGKKYD
jgi:hypothetical protein